MNALHQAVDYRGISRRPAFKSRGIGTLQAEQRSFAPTGHAGGGGVDMQVQGIVTLKKPRDTTPSGKIIRDEAFAKRFTTALDNNPKVPPVNYGRLTWVQNELKKHDENVSLETVRKWITGESRPRPDKIGVLATMLEVDHSWLAVGSRVDVSPREQKARDATVSGAVNLVAGLVQMGGGSPAFPTADDVRARDAHVDLYAIIKGAQYAFHVNVGDKGKDHCTFLVPASHQDAFQIGVVLEGGLNVSLFELTESVIADFGKRKSGSVEVTVPWEQLDENRIESFAQRL